LINNPSYQDFATGDDSDYPELWDGCVGAWAPCLGPSGLRLHDNSGRQNWGTLTNMDAATDWVVDGGRYALDFDGTDDVVTSPLRLGGLQRMSIAMWAKPRASNSRIEVAQGTSLSFSMQFGLAENGTVLFWPLFINNRAITDWSAFGTSWNHYCVVYDGTKTGNDARVQIYINGKIRPLTFAGTIDASVGSYDVDFRIGSRAAGAAWSNGNIDDLLIYNRLLFPSEIGLLWGGGRGIAYTPRGHRRSIFLGPTFNAAWARGSNQFIQPSLIGVA